MSTEQISTRQTNRKTAAMELERPSMRHKVVAWLIGAVTAVVVGLVIAGISNAWWGPAGAEKRGPEAAVAESAVASEPAASGNMASPGSTAVARATAVAASPLTVDGAADQARCAVPGWTGWPWESTAEPVAGRSFTAGFSCTMGYRHSTGYLDFVVPDGYALLQVNAGQADTSENTTLVVRFEVLDAVTSAVLSTSDLSYGQSMELEVDVSEVRRVRLQASTVGFSIEPKEKPSRASWGEPRFSSGSVE